jgi:hypothetical protein
LSQPIRSALRCFRPALGATPPDRRCPIRVLFCRPQLNQVAWKKVAPYALKCRAMVRKPSQSGMLTHGSSGGAGAARMSDDLDDHIDLDGGWGPGGCRLEGAWLWHPSTAGRSCEYGRVRHVSHRGMVLLRMPTSNTSIDVTYVCVRKVVVVGFQGGADCRQCPGAECRVQVHRRRVSLRLSTPWAA